MTQLTEESRPAKSFHEVLAEERTALFGEEPTDSNSAMRAGDQKALADVYGQIHRAPPARAICLSGGGIRSATFNLGLIQGLARAGYLSTFDYLSTVSGG